MFAVNPNAAAQNPPVFSLKTEVRVEWLRASALNALALRKF
jgi:hypothetical protein